MPQTRISWEGKDSGKHLPEVLAVAWQCRLPKGRSAPMLCCCRTAALHAKQTGCFGAQGALAVHGTPARVAWAALADLIFSTRCTWRKLGDQ